MKWVHPNNEPVTFDEVYRVLVTLDNVLAYLCPALHKAKLAPCPDHCYYRLELDDSEDALIKGPVISIIFETYHGKESSTYGIDISIVEIHLPTNELVELIRKRQEIIKKRESNPFSLDLLNTTPF